MPCWCASHNFVVLWGMVTAPVSLGVVLRFQLYTAGWIGDMLSMQVLRFVSLYLYMFSTIFPGACTMVHSV